MQLSFQIKIGFYCSLHHPWISHGVLSLLEIDNGEDMPTVSRFQSFY